MTLYKWSQTASADATADGTINWAEGQSPSSVNDSARAMMAATAKYRDDIAGAIVTGGTSTAFTVSSYEVFDTLARMNGAMIAFTPHATNGATVTLNVDSLGTKPLRSAPNAELLAGVLIQGTPYVATYNNSDGAWYLQNFFGNPYNVPLCSGMDYWGSTAPNSSFIFPLGQAISRTTFATAFAIMGTTYGAGDGSTTFNVPDKGERVSVMKVATGSRLTTAGGGVDGGTLGAVGGAQTQTLLTANLPPYTPAGSVSVTSTGGATVVQSSGPTDNFASIAGAAVQTNQTRSAITSTGSLTGTAQGGTSTPFRTMQPTIVCNYIVRII
jgi:microcystin-dependent protein